MKLAVIVVYFLSDDDIPILELHLNSIQRHTHHNFTIYGIATRVSQLVIETLKRYDFVELVKAETTPLVGSKEHSHYLDILTEHAIKSGATHICTMDVDSFPIKQGWDVDLLHLIDEENPLAAVFRSENGDTALPHPCCTFFSSEFYLKYKPSFYPSDNTLRQADFMSFISENGQSIDSGIGYGYTLWKNNTNWKRITRSNIKNDHYLLAGIYGNIIFHLGSMGWAKRDFRMDRNNSYILNTTAFLRRRMEIMGCYQGAIKHIIEIIDYKTSAMIASKNSSVYTKIRANLINNSEGYFKYLSKK